MHSSEGRPPPGTPWWRLAAVAGLGWGPGAGCAHEPADRGLRADQRLPHRGDGRTGRQHRLAVLPALRLRVDVRGAARQRGARALAGGARRWGAVASREYLERTFVLATRWVTRSGELEVLDFMPVSDQRGEVARRVRCLSGSVEVREDLRVRFGYAASLPWLRQLERDGGCDLVAVAGPDAVVRRGPRLTARDLLHEATYTLTAGQSVDLTSRGSNRIVRCRSRWTSEWPWTPRWRGGGGGRRPRGGPRRRRDVQVVQLVSWRRQVNKVAAGRVCLVQLATCTGEQG